MPGPWSRTSTRQPVIAISIGPSLYFIALSTRFASARSAMCGRTSTVPGPPSSTTVISRPVRAARPFGDVVGERARARPARGASSSPRSVASSTSSETRSVSSFDLEPDALDRLARCSASSCVGAVEQLGVRAQAGERRAQLVARVGDELLLLPLRRRASASTIVEKLVARLPTSPPPASGIGHVEVLGPGDALGRRRAAARSAAPCRRANSQPSRAAARDRRPRLSSAAAAAAATRARPRSRPASARSGATPPSGRATVSTRYARAARSSRCAGADVRRRVPARGRPRVDREVAARRRCTR